jgi:hypothetical protein
MIPGHDCEDLSVTHVWAPKSAKDDDDAAVVQARRWHTVLVLAFVALGVLAGYMVFQLADNRLAIAALDELYDDEAEWEILLCGLYMAVLGWLAGEGGNAAWLLLCRYELRLSAEQVRAALDGRVTFSFVLHPLRARLFSA